GGQKVRVLLAQALFGNPTALLLDEPTNNLDLDSVHWLQRYLCDYEGVLIVISHDRHFLNSVCTYTADIDYETIIMYVGGYDDMVVAKTQIRGRIEADNVHREKKIALMGRNGTGKTTLLKSLVRNAPGYIEEKDQQFPIDGGEVRWGHEVAVGYFAQDHGESITKGMTAIEWLWQFDPAASQQELRGLMGQMLFSGEDALKPTRALSGGESARLI